MGAPQSPGLPEGCRAPSSPRWAPGVTRKALEIGGTKADKVGGERKSPLYSLAPSLDFFTQMVRRGPCAAVDFAWSPHPQTTGDFALCMDFLSKHCLGPSVGCRGPAWNTVGPKSKAEETKVAGAPSVLASLPSGPCYSSAVPSSVCLVREIRKPQSSRSERCRWGGNVRNF